jgi:inner membrane protein
MVVLGSMVLVLLIPLVRIGFLVDERSERQQQVSAEVAQLWGGEQVLAGPVLTVPFRLPATKDEKPQIHVAQFLPSRVGWSGTVKPEIRYRGIFEVVVYDSEIAASGAFGRPWHPAWGEEGVEVLWDRASVSVGVPDMRGLQRRTVLSWGDGRIGFEPGSESSVLPSGIHAPVTGLENLEDGAEITFAFDLGLRGSGRLAFVPVGEDTRVSLSSPWNDPGFYGAFLPTEREVTAKGFTAHWEVPFLSRDYPQEWIDDAVERHHLLASCFGVALVLPADGYQQTMRSVKYGVLFIVLTFVTFFMIEVVSPVRLHPAQYLLVGFALCLFYVLLLALSEQFGFPIAYAAATGAIVLLIAGYAKSILASARWALVLAGCLAGLYGYLYVLIQLEELSLLLGAVGLLAILALIMYLTRHLDWTALRFRTPAGGTVP